MAGMQERTRRLSEILVVVSRRAVSPRAADELQAREGKPAPSERAEYNAPKATASTIGSQHGQHCLPSARMVNGSLSFESEALDPVGCKYSAVWSAQCPLNVHSNGVICE